MEDWLPLIGVVIARFVILLLFWLKQRGDDQRRWHEKRLDSFGRYRRPGETLRASSRPPRARTTSTIVAS